MSMKPGATTSPLASITRFAFPSGTRPTATIRSPGIATSPRNHGLPVPSTIRPLRMTRSYSGSAARAHAAGREDRDGEHDSHGLDPHEYLLAIHPEQDEPEHGEHGQPRDERLVRAPNCLNTFVPK